MNRSMQYISSYNSALRRTTRTINSISFLIIHLTISFFIYPLPFLAPLKLSSCWLWSGQVDKLSRCHACYSGFSFQIVAEDCLHLWTQSGSPQAALFPQGCSIKVNIKRAPTDSRTKAGELPRNYKVLRTPA